MTDYARAVNPRHLSPLPNNPAAWLVSIEGSPRGALALYTERRSYHVTGRNEEEARAAALDTAWTMESLEHVRIRSIQRMARKNGPACRIRYTLKTGC
jgi:hypothetical protein